MRVTGTKMQMVGDEAYNSPTLGLNISPMNFMI